MKEQTKSAQLCIELMNTCKERWNTIENKYYSISLRSPLTWAISVFFSNVLEVVFLFQGRHPFLYKKIEPQVPSSAGLIIEKSHLFFKRPFLLMKKTRNSPAAALCLYLRAGHFRYFWNFSNSKKLYFCICYKVNLFLHQSNLNGPLPVSN